MCVCLSAEACALLMPLKTIPASLPFCLSVCPANMNFHTTVITDISSTNSIFLNLRTSAFRAL